MASSDDMIEIQVRSQQAPEAIKYSDGQWWNSSIRALYKFILCQTPWRRLSRRTGCTSGCLAKCRICNREVTCTNLGRGYFAPRSTQPSIPAGSVNEYQLRLGRQRQV